MTVFGLFGFDGPAPTSALGYDALRRYLRRRVVAALAPSGLLLGAALVLMARRLAGALVDPPSLGTAVCWAMAMLVAGRISKLVVRRSFGGRDVQMPIRFLMALDSAHVVLWIAALLAAGAMSLPRISPAAAAALWLPVVLPPAALFFPGVAGWFRAPAADDSAAESADRYAEPSPGPRPDIEAGEPMGIGPVAPSETPEPPVAAGQVTARMTRYLTAAGIDVVEGAVAVDFAAGARWGAAHLAICPPLAGAPQVDVELEDDVEAEVKVTQALPYAARFDVRLPKPAEEHISVQIRYRLAFATERRPNSVQP